MVFPRYTPTRSSFENAARASGEAAVHTSSQSPWGLGVKTPVTGVSAPWSKQSGRAPKSTPFSQSKFQELMMKVKASKHCTCMEDLSLQRGPVN